MVIRFGWRVAFRTAGVLIFFFGMICCYSFSSKEEVSHDQFENEEEEETQSMEVSVYGEPSPEPMHRKCCTIEELKQTPEIILWYGGNMLSYLGFYMPFLNLVSV